MLYGLIFFPQGMALVTWLFGRKSDRARNLLAVLTCAATLVLAIYVAMQPEKSAHIPFVAGIGLALETDGFRRVYVVVIALLWLMTTLCGCEYFVGHKNVCRYYFFNLMTLGATMGVFLSADLFTALVFFEILSFTSYTWVAQEESEAAMRAANTYLAVAVIGGLAALMGLFLLWHTLGTTTIAKLYDAAAACGKKQILYAAGGCVLFGFGAKAGMFPLHVWLPKAHPVAPAPASALLSGLLTKSGIFGVLAISCNLFRNDPAWGTLLLALGAVTMVLGALLALFSIDLKRTLACSSVSQIGFVLIGIGMMGVLGEDNALAARGTLLHMMNHSLFKLVLFTAAGVVYRNLHELDLNAIRGFGRKKPLLLVSFLFGALGIGGVPLFNGYVSKTLLHESIAEGIAQLKAYGLPAFGLHAVEWLFLLAGGITVAYMTKLFVALFWEEHPLRQAESDGMRRYMRLGSVFALFGSALLLPALGLSAHISMNGIADLGTDFLHAGALAHAVRYFAWENLQGSLISIGIGFVLYFGVVRTLLTERQGNVRVYVDRWPKRLDLEELLYRPLLLKWLPGILGPIAALFGENRITAPLARGVFRGAAVVAHALSDLPDALILLLRKTAYRESRPPVEDTTEATLPYRFGEQIDRVAILLGKERKGGHHYARLAYRVRGTLRQTGRRITGNLSFALLMLVLAISFVFLYILIL